MADEVREFVRAAGRLGGLTTASRHDMRAMSALGRQAFEARFEAEVDPEGVLSTEERQRRAESARKLYYARLAWKSAQVRKARRVKKGATGELAAATG
jgi:hypothetical protein